ncbi:MAG: cysteine synthase A [Bacteroidota bacterium]
MQLMNLLSKIGNTPLVSVPHTEVNLLAKLEFYNPSGSVKARAALAMIEDGEARGMLSSKTKIIEPTSGNTGIALAMVCAIKGYHITLVMPESMSMERKKMMQVYGAELVLTPAAFGMKGAVDKAREMINEIPDAWMPMQFDNPANPEMHFKTTGPEIWKDTKGVIDFFVAGVGTGGTISGAGKFLKSKNSTIKNIAVEPAESAVLSGKAAGKHGIQGLGAGFIPGVFDKNVIDEIICVATDDAMKHARKLCKKHGIFCGISSGANYAAALTVAARPENKGKTIVFIVPDTGERYLSTDLFKEENV